MARRPYMAKWVLIYRSIGYLLGMKPTTTLVSFLFLKGLSWMCTRVQTWHHPHPRPVTDINRVFYSRFLKVDRHVLFLLLCRGLQEGFMGFLLAKGQRRELFESCFVEDPIRFGSILWMITWFNPCLANRHMVTANISASSQSKQNPETRN